MDCKKCGLTIWPDPVVNGTIEKSGLCPSCYRLEEMSALMDSTVAPEPAARASVSALKGTRTGVVAVVLMSLFAKLNLDEGTTVLLASGALALFETVRNYVKKQYGQRWPILEVIL